MKHIAFNNIYEISRGDINNHNNSSGGTEGVRKQQIQQGGDTRGQEFRRPSTKMLREQQLPNGSMGQISEKQQTQWIRQN